MTNETGRDDGPPQSDERRNLRFLALAGFMLFLALLDYLLLDTLDVYGAGAVINALVTGLALLLMLLVMAALFFVVCYTSPKIGRAVEIKGQYMKDAWGVPFRHFGLGGFKIDHGSEEVKAARRRMEHRHARRRYVRETRRQAD